MMAAMGYWTNTRNIGIYMYICVYLYIQYIYIYIYTHISLYNYKRPCSIMVSDVRCQSSHNPHWGSWKHVRLTCFARLVLFEGNPSSKLGYRIKDSGIITLSQEDSQWPVIATQFHTYHIIVVKAHLKTPDLNIHIYTPRVYAIYIDEVNSDPIIYIYVCVRVYIYIYMYKFAYVYI